MARLTVTVVDIELRLLTLGINLKLVVNLQQASSKLKLAVMRLHKFLLPILLTKSTKGHRCILVRCRVYRATWTDYLKWIAFALLREV